MIEFEKLVWQMREKQREYSRTQSKESLQKAKVLERSVDYHLLHNIKFEQKDNQN